MFIIIIIIIIIITIIPIRITGLQLQGSPRALADPTDPDRLTSIDLVAPSRSTSRPSCPEAPRVARPRRVESPDEPPDARPMRLKRQKSTEKGARERPRRDFRGFWIVFRVDFRGFSRLQRASDSTCSAKCRTSVSAGRRITSGRFSILRKNRKSTKNRRKIAPTGLRDPGARKFSLPATNRRRN